MSSFTQARNLINAGFSMSNANDTLTVEDIRKLALPLGTHVVTGDGLLNRPVSWTSVIYLDDNLASKTLQSDEMLIVVRPNQPKTSITKDVDIVRWAAEQKASALLMFDAPSPTALAEARAYSIPIMTLPQGSRPRMIEKNIVSLLVDRKGQFERRGTQIYRQLTQISSRNEGLPELVNAIARLTGKAVVVQDKRMHVSAYTLQPQFVAIWDDIEAFLRKKDNLPVDFQDRYHVNEADEVVLMQSLSMPGLARLVSPIITKGVGRGYLSIIGHDNELDDVDLLVAEQGAAACALEMAKLKAVSETEKRLRGTFLDRLLIGDVSQQEAIRQGERFDHDMNASHLALVVSWRKNDQQLSNRRLETTINSVLEAQRAKALVWQREREKEVVVFHSTDSSNPIDNSLVLAEAFTKQINRQYPNSGIAIGLGQPAKDVSAWRNSYRDAVQARDLAVRLQTDTPLYIGDLGVYQLILSLNDREKLTEFCKHTLGTLIDYDMRQNADLIKTLEAFFTCHGNLSQTAEMLIVHRNTLLYRMNRINEIADIDLNRPETRLALHLALTIQRLI
jgi:purine catabolism regulator